MALARAAIESGQGWVPKDLGNQRAGQQSHLETTGADYHRRHHYCSCYRQISGVADLGRQSWREEGSPCITALRPPQQTSTGNTPQLFPPDVISALIKMSSPDSGGAANKRTKNNNYLLGTMPGPLEFPVKEASVGGGGSVQLGVWGEGCAFLSVYGMQAGVRGFLGAGEHGISESKPSTPSSPVKAPGLTRGKKAVIFSRSQEMPLCFSAWETGE